ncbi:hypothetical protein ANRL4_01943 [Anaerolineae bacterium]|nr:hypothetical protein ANRL4_01943 [Anaerolineae bacterium]
MKRLFAAAVLSVLGLSSNAYATQYTLEAIEYPDSVWTRVNGINNKGHVVGAYSDGTTTHGYIYNENGFTTVDFPGAVQTSLEGINDSGKVVGWYNFNGQGIGYNTTYGFLYDNVAYFSVAFSGGNYGLGIPDDIAFNGINNKDTAVGQYWVGGERGFTYDEGTISNQFGAYGEDINDNGVIVAHWVEPETQSWLIINGDFHDFNGLENVHALDALGINNLGQVVGVLVGREDFFSGNFIYDDEFKLLDLPGVVNDINDSGQIVGNAQFAYIATPSNSTAVTEPSSMILLGLAGAGIFAAHRYSRSDTGSRLA